MTKLLRRLLPVRVHEFKYHPHGTPIPRGWTVAEDIRSRCVHHEYSVIISRKRWTWDH